MKKKETDENSSIKNKKTKFISFVKPKQYQNFDELIHI